MLFTAIVQSECTAATPRNNRLNDDDDREDDVDDKDIGPCCGGYGVLSPFFVLVVGE